MSKKTRKKQKREEVKSMVQTICTSISAGIAVAAFVLSVLTLVQQKKYQEADYEYKRSPIFEVHATAEQQDEVINGEWFHVMYPHSFSFEFESLNNLERLYGVAPDFTVEEIDTEDIEASLRNYFTQAFADKHPSIMIGDQWYFYRFLVIQAVDGSTDLQLYMYKTSPLKTGTGGQVEFGFDRLDRVTLLTLIKSHPNEEDYAGERQIAAQYRENQDYIFDND